MTKYFIREWVSRMHATKGKEMKICPLLHRQWQRKKSGDKFQILLINFKIIYCLFEQINSSIIVCGLYDNLAARLEGTKI